MNQNKKPKQTLESAQYGLDISFKAKIGHFRILGIGLELACNGGSCGGMSLKRDECNLNLKRLPRISLTCKLVPVQYWEYENGLLGVFLAGHKVAMVTYCVTKAIPTCSTIIGQFFDVIIVASTYKEW